MKVKDFILDEDGDIKIKNGDFQLHESDAVHIEHILRSNKGYFFETPLLGVGIINELNGSKTRQELRQTIRRQLVLDNFSVKSIDISNDYQLSINATRRL